jgi:hypothetical protein
MPDFGHKKWFLVSQPYTPSTALLDVIPPQVVSVGHLAAKEEIISVHKAANGTSLVEPARNFPFPIMAYERRNTLSAKSK